MEEVLTATGFIPEIIWSGISDEVIDYRIISYMVDMNVIEKGFQHPKLQIYCGEVRNSREEHSNVHCIKYDQGILHSKIIIVSTSTVLRIIIMAILF